MKITLPPYILAAGLEQNEHPQDLVINGQNVTQVSRTIRSDSVNTFNRGNIKTRVSFKVDRMHPTNEAAFYYALRHASYMLKAQGDVQFVLEGCPNEETFTLKNATLEKVESKAEGNISIHWYVLVGGLVE